MDQFRMEHDSMGDVAVPEEKYWGAQTQRSLNNFNIGWELMPAEVICAIATVKRAAAGTNRLLCPERMSGEKAALIEKAADEIRDGRLMDHFPLHVWQTGSGTQTNMNVNEVIANRANQLAGKTLIHPNDDVNMSQSSNDVFPSAMHICAVMGIKKQLIPVLDGLIETMLRLENDNQGILKIGRTHLQDATPIRFSQEISGWRSTLQKDRELLMLAIEPLRELALGGTAVGTGLNAPAGFDKAVCEEISAITGECFVPAQNKFHALTSKNELVFSHGALKALAADLMKIANDVRWLASGPRCGLGEIQIPSNEPGSSIMPGKVNPTQCEAITMLALQIMGNDASISAAASQGNFQLNVFMPLCIYNYLQSIRLLTDGMLSFNKHCVDGIKANKAAMSAYLNNSLMLATALNAHIGYEKSARVVRKAYEENLTLRDSCVQLGYLTKEAFDAAFCVEDMC